MTDHSGLLDSLPTLQRVALAYCPVAARAPTLALFALDARLASLIRRSSEPMLAQLRLAWWRETLAAGPGQWPKGDPLLAALRSWEGDLDALSALVDGWEAMTAPAPLGADAIEELAAARGAVFAALSRIIGVPGQGEVAARRGRAWALADIASPLAHPGEVRTAAALAAREDWRTGGLSRRLRPLAVLHGLAARSARRGAAFGQDGPGSLLGTIRLGLLGR